MSGLESLPVKLKSRILVDQTTGCWNWTAAHDEHGYGRVQFDGKLRISHRLIWHLLKGDPGILCVLHKCDNPPCGNPEHLFLGTKKDNAQDMSRKGRASKQQDTHCFRGHPFDAANTRINGTSGRRQCKLCQKLNYQASRDAAKSITDEFLRTQGVHV